MANKKAGSRAAAGQAKARERARRKARVGGPSVPAAAYASPVEDDGAGHAEAVREPDAAPGVADAPAPTPRPAPRAAAPARESAAPVRRERVAAAMTPTGSLKRELALIASLTALIAAALAALEVTNALGA